MLSNIFSFMLGAAGGFIVASDAMNQNPKDVFDSLFDKYNICQTTDKHSKDNIIDDDIMNIEN